MEIVGLVGAGHMGSGLGWALREGGHDVITSLAGRSARTARLAQAAGLRVVARPADVVAQADVILVVTPPGAAVDAATEIAAMAGARRDRPLVVDLNAISPATAAEAAEVITAAGFDFVDGSISGPPPTVRPGAALYLSGPRAAEVADLRWTHARPVVVGDRIGAASAVKMSTASVYKGLMGLMTQAIRSASEHGVLEPVMADLGESFGTPYEMALAATKAHRYVAEMREIARSQAAAGLTPSLFEAFAEVWADIADRPLADGQPETLPRAITARQVADGLRQ
ncbi:NAD(P)-binding domain-containing protein [Amorphoplanes digitatis]|uniref:3-hydroxyisobutyrate dehydrogenase-like beta-hydroxyacid dehydrogenase n=1 Tax=Actinoplanes digitatis TaxID=1868 RepID=A0A7W7MUT0_9ACTN|nr:NAD(P)-dependent oxidoreductase [Actinoplanes digitatis]MBB4767075.1 3-hydroxyisobutyrate dehydrogenase-like beta-hydroxyacid dehydrogenase [Actinoplanes digitatis]GID95560.1 6-phosphogluconate dehydrogenase [Actinoplanes digitatis]